MRDRKHKAEAEDAKLTKAIIDKTVKEAPTTSNVGLYVGGEWKSSVQQVHIRMEPITWGFPMDEMMFSRFFESMLCHQRPMPWDNIAISRSTYLPTARNAIHMAFVTEHKTKWLAMLDSDIMPPPNYITKLLADAKENPDIKIIGGWYKRKTGLQDPVVYNFVRDMAWEQYKERKKGITTVDGAGAGCWLMSREVAMSVGGQPYNMNQGGEDLNICRKITAEGYKLYIDWDVECAHIGVGVY